MNDRTPFSIIHFPVVGSTNLWAESNLSLLVSRYGLSPTKPVRISADHQTNGVGQAEFVKGVRTVRQWVGQEATTAVAKVLISLGLTPTVKWINDVLVNDKKICGVLCNSTGFTIIDDAITDAEGQPEKYVAVLLGIGLNVKAIPSLRGLADDEQQSITSIACELEKRHQSQLNMTDREVNAGDTIYEKGLPIDTANVLFRLSMEVYKAMGVLETYGYKPIHEYISPILHGRGTCVTVVGAGDCSVRSHENSRRANEFEDVLTGILVGLSPESGGLQLQLVSGEIKNLFFGRLLLH